MTIINGQTISNGRYPAPPSVGSTGNLCFPSDLINNRNFYITLQLATYNRTNVLSSPNLSPGSAYTLPIPIKINDIQTVLWEQSSLTSQGLALASAAGNLVAPALTQAISKIANIAGNAEPALSYSTGLSVNPALVMLFKTQNFKQHSLQWILAPNNAEDSQNLQTIIKSLKNGMLPTNQGLVLGYPNILIPSLSVSGTTFNFKPCAITSLSVDWSAGATPAFFNDQNPAFVSLTMQLTEIELWFQGEI